MMVIAVRMPVVAMSTHCGPRGSLRWARHVPAHLARPRPFPAHPEPRPFRELARSQGDRKSTRLNSSHVAISYAVFCLKKKTLIKINVKTRNNKYQKRNLTINYYNTLLFQSTRLI